MVTLRNGGTSPRTIAIRGPLTNRGTVSDIFLLLLVFQLKLGIHPTDVSLCHSQMVCSSYLSLISRRNIEQQEWI